MFNLSKLLKLLGRCPLTLRILLGRGFGFTFGLIPTREQRIARLQILKYLGHRTKALLVFRTYANFGQVILESLNLQPYLQSKESVQINNQLLIDHLCLKNAKGVVALTAHLGNWELLAAKMITLGFDVLTFAKQATKPQLQSPLQDMRSEYGLKVVWRTGNVAIKSILEHIRKDGVVTGLIDQDTDVASDFIPFFGEPAKTPSSLVQIAKKNSLPIVFAFSRRVSFQKYEIDLISVPDTYDTRAVLESFNRELEMRIRRNPEQWVWVHKRWRSLPDGRKLNSREYIKYLQEAISKQS